MSWVFLAGDKVYKLKKPVRFAYLDFSTLARREAACRAEDRLNRRLAPDVYLGIVPLTETSGGLSLDGPGAVVDWLVVVRRLDERRTLEAAITEERLDPRDLDRILHTLVAFYRRARPTLTPPAAHLWQWHQSIALNRRILLDAMLDIPRGLVRRVDGVQRRFLRTHAARLEQRARTHRIVDGHGDLRRSTSGSTTASASSTASSSTRRCARSTRPTRSPTSVSSASGSGPGPARRLQQRFRRAWPHAAGLDFFCSTAVTAPPCAPGWRSRTCSSPIRARRRNGRGSRASISRSPPPMRDGSSAFRRPADR